jgi:hypothetical protein
MAVEFSLSSLPTYTLRVDLDEVEYRVDMRYLERTDSWMLDLYTSDDVAIKIGVPCLLGVRILKGCTHANRPPGDLVFVDSEGRGVEAGQSDIGSRVTLVYLTAEEVAEVYG